MGPAHCCEQGAVSANEKYRQAADPEGKAKARGETAVHRLVQQNEETIRRATYFSSEVRLAGDRLAGVNNCCLGLFPR